MGQRLANHESDPILIEASGLRRTFDEGRVEALRGLDFAIAPGDFIAIQGPSGSGKSTLLHILGALDAPSGGELRFRGTPLDRLGNLAAFRARTVGFVFQSSYLLPTLSALENVQIPMFEMPWPARERRTRALALLDAVGLSDRLDRRPATLSGGERQRVAIARSLANEPLLLLADEPTGNLDSANAARIMALLQTIHAGRSMTLIVVTHDGTVAGQAHRVLQMLTILQTVQTTIDVNGSAFGAGDPPPQTFSGPYSPGSGAVFAGVSAFFGTVAFNVSSTGQVTGSMTNVPAANIARSDFTGTMTPTTATGYVHGHFHGGYGAGDRHHYPHQAIGSPARPTETRDSVVHARTPRMSEETHRHRFKQPLEVDGLVDERLVFPQHDLFLEEAVAVAREIQDLHVRVPLPQPPAQFVARHLGHHEVDDEQIERTPRFRD